MKTKFLFVAVVMVGALMSAVAAEEPVTRGMVVVPVKGSHVYKVIYKGETSGKVKLNIYNDYSRLIFSQSLHAMDGFICPVNFSGLPAGEYTIEVVDAEGRKVQTVRHEVIKGSETTAHVNRLRDQANRYLLSFVGNKAADVTVRIFNESGKLLFEETRPTEGQFAKIYTLNANLGKVTFEISDSEGSVKTVRF